MRFKRKLPIASILVKFKLKLARYTGLNCPKFNPFKPRSIDRMSLFQRAMCINGLVWPPYEAKI